jgi:hypothetical protein
MQYNVTINWPKADSSNRSQAVIFMGIVLVFLVSHLPRILLSLHEMVIIKQVAVEQ